MSNADLDKFLGECPTHKKLPWKIGAMESGQDRRRAQGRDDEEARQP